MTTLLAVRGVTRICESRDGTATPSGPATAHEWADRLGVTAKTVHRLFLKETGMTFAQWRDQARLLHALQRIAEGWRVIDVALDCGYSSQSAFTAMFRRHFGVPPSGLNRSTPAPAGRAPPASIAAPITPAPPRPAPP